LIIRLKSLILESVFRLSRFGQRHGWERVTYHPGVFAFFHWTARQQAPGVVGSLLEAFPHAHSFVDVGAGTGVYAAGLKRAGRHVVACERSGVGRLIARWQGVPAVRFDLNDQKPAIRERVDVAYSFEVAEHLRPALGSRLVQMMCALAPTVVFSAAQPGQGGQGHVNEQPPSYWAQQFTREGFDLDAGLTGELASRMAAAGTVLWITPNVQVFTRRA
jgi:SAM-dependent methyltransferase